MIAMARERVTGQRCKRAWLLQAWSIVDRCRGGLYAVLLQNGQGDSQASTHATARVAMTTPPCHPILITSAAADMV
jgi:hypothetical protein